MKPKLLLVIPDLGPGGAQPMNLRLARELSNRGWNLKVAALFDRWQVIADDQYNGLDIVFLAPPGLRGKIYALFRLIRLAKDADLVIGGVECAATTYSYLAAYLAKRPFVSWTHIAFHLHQTRLGFFNRTISRLVYRRAQYVVLPSHGARDSLLLALGKKPAHAKWEVIENFLSPGTPAPTQTPPDAKIFSKPVLMGIGRLDLQKAFDRLIRAHAFLLAQGIEHHLVILGEGAQRQELVAEVQRLGLEGSTFLPGHVPDVPLWLSHATVFGLCSKYEGFALVLLEALALGVPAVAMDCPSGPREILRDGWAGLLTPDADERGFQESLAKLFLSKELRAMLAERGKERADYYSSERIVPSWELLLTQM